MKPTTRRHLKPALFALLFGPILALHAQTWKDTVGSPVNNPIFFEDPFIRTELRPLFMYNKIGSDFAVPGGDIYLYAMQARWAVTDRLAIIATKDGYVDANTQAPLNHREGFADISVGMKYALIDNPDKQFILTPGFELELPVGNQDVFQGNGKGEWDLFVSTAKAWGKFHVLANVGARIPNDFGRETASLHYSAQAGYQICKYFTPFVSLNAFTTLNNGNGPFAGLTDEGYDLINFGAGKAAGDTKVLLGGGFSSRLCQYAEFGFGYEAAVTQPKGLVDWRVTSHIIIKF